MSHFVDFASRIARLFSVSPAYRKRPGRIHAIINPAAGLFSSRDRLRSSLSILARQMLRLGLRPDDDIPLSVHLTEHPGHAVRLVERIVADGSGNDLILSAGGDGTHLDVLTGVMQASPRHAYSVFRLPAGTGNDGADAITLRDAYKKLPHLSRFENQSALVVETADKRRFFSFNIASFGLDAYVAHMTNKLKHRFPGNSYTVVADVATLFYVPVYGVPRVRLTISTDAGAVEQRSGRYALVAFGVSGHRRYGGDKPILPLDENLVSIDLPDFMGRLRLKQHVYRGTHVHDPETLLSRMDAMVVESSERLPFQFDGESVWLEPSSFPVTVRRLKGAWRGLSAAGPGA